MKKILALCVLLFFTTLINAQTGFAYIPGSNPVFPYGSLLYVVNTATNTVVTTIPIGGPPRGAAISPDGSRVYSTNAGSNSVYFINTANNTIVATVNVGANPQDIVVSPDGSRLYVANYLNNNVSVINTITNTVVGTVAAGSNPAGVAISPDGSKVYVTNNNSDNVTVINTASNIPVASVQVGGHPVGVCVSPNGSRVYVANYLTNNLSIINTADNTVVGTLPVGTFPYGVSISPDGSRVYVANTVSNDVTVINTATNTVVATVAVGSNPQGVCVTPDGSRVYVCNLVSDNVSVINTATHTVVATIPGIIQPFVFSNFISNGVDITKYYVNDNNTTGDVFTTAVGNNANNGLPATPFATLTYALSKATEGDTIYVDAGTYAEQVTIDKGITIIGAGQNLTSILKPAVTVAPPGPFTEQGVIQTAQNIGDVHIKDISVTGDGITSIIIQSGGSVKNCKLQNGNQGIFARVDPATNSSAKTFVVENNIINAEYIGVNFAGTNLTASLLNNEIAAFNTGFSTGVFAGVDFGNLPNFTATGNKFSNYVSNGFQINANNSMVSQNSFLGSGAVAIQKGGGNTLNATCNWYGSSDQFVVASKINGNVNFSPWLVNGTDNDPGAIGFQPISNSCSGRQMLYVNDNSLTGNIYTTAVGNNANNGSPSAPLTTITAALAKAQAGDTIIVDAGSYTEAVTVTKNITIRGAGMGLTILNGPAAHIVPLAGAFESGIIQSTSGLTDVIIENLTIDGSISDESHGTFIQGGGRISNCELRYVNDGFYFQYISTQPRTAVGENNYVHHINYVGSLFAGNGITAIANNNVIDLTGALYGMGFIAGYGGDGNVASFTASNNSIINVNGFGMMIGSLQTAQVHNNSITRVTSNNLFIQNQHTVNIDATCNWYGTTDAGLIIPQMLGAVTFSPWLSNGTDNDVAFGFQPVGGACNGRQNKFYVNDNSLTGDVFTTAVGNDANAGIPSSPLLTISTALTKASAGDSIFVDAGTYAMANLSINKSITILGSNYLISPNNSGNKTLYNTSRNAESRITGGTLVMQADWIYVNGMRISSNTAILVSGNYSHIKMDKNYFDMATTASTVNLSGSLTANDYAITDNRFERQDAFAGDGVFLSAVASSWIDNNTFIELNASPFRGFALRTAGNADVSNVIFTNNYVKKLNVGVLPFRVQSLLVSNNMFDSCSAGYNQTPQGSVSNNITISGNTFNNIRVARSILVRGGTGGGINNLNIAGNTINQAVDGINGIVGMIQLDYAVANAFGTTTVSGNKINISGNYANTGVGSNVGIMIVGEHTNTTISSNELTFTAINASAPSVPVLPPVPTGIFINTDPGAASGLIPSNAIINITNNKINGFKSSIGFYDPSASNITPNVGYGYLTAGAQVNIHENSFVNDSMSIDNGAVSQNINASCNFYNTNIPEIIITKISPNTGDYEPWLVNGTDNEPLITGFQPVPGSCTGRVTKFYVNDAVTTGDMFTTKTGDDVNGYGLFTSPFATITRALQEAQAGDSIFVDAGTYVLSGDLTINKSVKIIGTNYQLSPNDATDKKILNAVRNAETVISNATLIIGSNDISIQGVVLDPGTAAIAVFFSNSNYNNISLLKNRVKMNSTSPSVRFEGQGTSSVTLSGLVNSNYVITDNRFEKYDAGNSAAINISRLKNVTVIDNAFVVGGSTVRNYSAIVLGNVGVVDALTFSNNTVDRAGIAIGGNRIANVIASGNKIYNTSNAINTTNINPESSNIDFSNNLLDGSNGILPFINYNRQGGNTAGASNQFKAENNTITAIAVPGTTTLLGAFNVTYFNGVLNSSAIIRGNTMNFGGNLSSVEGQFLRPIFFRGNLQNVSIDHNEITLNGTNLQPRNPANVLPVCPAISLYTDNGVTSVLPVGAVINIQNNKIQGFKHSFVVFDPQAGSTPYTGFGNLANGITVNVNYNSFTGDSISINNGTTSNEINASCNWYGSSADQNFINKISLETVNPVPWLTNGTDGDAATGFQPTGGCDGYPPIIVLDNYTNVTCNGASNGSIHITTTYGKAPFIYTWTKDGDAGFVSHDEDPAGLAPGTYHLSVVDGNGSSIFINSFDADGLGSITVTITEPSMLTANANGTNVSCNAGNNGTASITAGGGTLPYSYSWSNGSTNASISNLTAGLYTVTVTDGSGCTKTASYQVTEPSILTANANGTNVSCYSGSNGTASVTAGGGTLPYSYLWSNGGTAASISNLTAGLYTVTVTDGNGCTKTASYQVTQPTLLTAVATGTSTSCANSATVVASGGTTPYSYSWSNGATAQSITSLPAGTYTVTVTDGNGCQITASCIVTANQAFNPSASVVNVSCFGGSNGSITVTNANGVAPFQYSINGVNFQGSNTFNGLASGTYTITVKDVNGCTGFVTKTILQPTQLVVSQGTVQSTCAGSNTGSITIIVSGGSPSYSYAWSGPNSYSSTQANISGLATGNYNVVVTDSKGCTASLPVTVNPFPAINVNANVTNVACRGDSSGSIDLTVTGGTGSGFTYLWTGGATTQDRVNLTNGNYNVTITDIGSSCVVTRSYTLTQPASALSLSATSTNVGGCNTLGTIAATGSGGTASYQYKLDAGAYQNSGSFTGLSGGTYIVWVKDANGCTKSVSKTINDGGGDEFENNNNKNNAAAISLGVTISSRIGTSGDIDFFKLSPANTWTGNYTISFVQPATAVVFDLVGSNGSTVIAPTASSSTYKQYSGLNGTYFVRVSGTNSLNCYQLTVTSGLLTRSSGSNIQQEVTKTKPSKDVFNVTAFPNPSNSSFNVKIESGSEELMNMRVLDASGRLIEEKKNIPSSQIVKLGERYINGVYLVEIVQGNNRKTVRLVKM